MSSTIQVVRDISRLWSARPLLLLAIVATIWIPMSLLQGWANHVSEALYSQMSAFGDLAGIWMSAALLTALASVEASYGGSLLRGLHSWSRLTVAMIVKYCLIGLGLICLILPGLFLAARLALVAPVLVLEKTNVRQAIARSFELTRGRLLQIVAFSALYLAVVIVSLLLTWPTFEKLDAASPLGLEVALTLLVALGIAFLNTGLLSLYQRYVAEEEDDGVENLTIESSSQPTKRSLHALLMPIVLVFSLMPAIRFSMVDWNDVPARSMMPTIFPGDRIVVDKAAYTLVFPFTSRVLSRKEGPSRGDVIVFRSPESGGLLVKRVVALPGETIEISGQRVSIDGVAAEFLEITTETAPELDLAIIELQGGASTMALELIGDSRYPIEVNPVIKSQDLPPVVVPEGQYFVLGDNRSNSRDSRFFGPVDQSSIVGKANFVALSFDKAGFWQPRWQRFFSRLL